MVNATNSRRKGGLGLVNVRLKCTSSLLATTLKNQKNDGSPNAVATEYNLGGRVPHLCSKRNRPIRFELGYMWKLQARKLKELFQMSPEVDWKEAGSRTIYQILLKKIIKNPKVVNKYPNSNYQKPFLNLSNQTLEAKTREHQFKLVHEILPTNDRKARSRRKKAESQEAKRTRARAEFKDPTNSKGCPISNYLTQEEREAVCEHCCDPTSTPSPQNRKRK